MIFSNSGAFWGLLFLLVPLIVHFFDFRRAKRIYFSNVFFLQSVATDSIPKNRLKEILLLITRCLALFFLVFVFIGPILIDDSDLRTDNELVIIDNSFSLADDCDGEPCLERIKRILQSYGEGTGRIELFHSGLQRPKSSFDSEELMTLLAVTEYEKSEFQINEFVKEERQLTILSDFQQPLVDLLHSDAFDSTRLLLLPVSRLSEANLMIDTAYLANRFSLGDQRKSLMVSIFNSGDRAFTNALVRLLNGNQHVSSLAIDINPEQTVLVELEFDMTDNSAFELRVEDSTYELDNRFYLTIPPSKKLKVCVIGGEANRNIDAIFTNEDYFDFSLFTERTVDFDKVLNADLVLFHSFDRLPGWADLSRLKGSVIIIPSAKIDLANYSNFMNSKLQLSTDSVMRELRLDGLRHPFFEGIFDKLDARTSMPETRVLYRTSDVNEELLGGSVPFLQRLTRDGKSIYFFGGPLASDYSSLQNHALFLPVMYRIAEQSVGADRPLYTRLSDKPVNLPVQLGSRNVQLNGMGAEFVSEIYPNQSSVSLILPNDLNSPGHYYLLADEDTLDVLALNIAREESLINWNDANALREVFQNRPYTRVLETESLDELQVGLREMKDGKPIWKYALLLALMFLVAEIAIHRWLK